MRETDPGHFYEDLLSLDGDCVQSIRFVKRSDPARPWRYPGNSGTYPGTTVQAVVRVLLRRLAYLQGQHWCLENLVSIWALRWVLWLLEFRAARRIGIFYRHGPRYAEQAPMCPLCGHTVRNRDHAGTMQ